jgi:hypothetical protein
MEEFFSLHHEKSSFSFFPFKIEDLLSNQNMNHYFEREIEIFEKINKKQLEDQTFEKYDDLSAIPMLEEEKLTLQIRIEKSNAILKHLKNQKKSNESQHTLK